MKTIALCLISISLFAQDFKPVDSLHTVDEVKSEIFVIAEFYSGKKDPDRKIRKTFKPYIKKLLRLSPMPPLKDRVDGLVGSWRQVWGPYRSMRKYGKKMQLDPKNIYQVVSKDAYYYKVSHYIDPKTKKTKATTLLRGNFAVKKKSTMQVSYAKLRRLRGELPAGENFLSLPRLSEAGKLENEQKIMPDLMVKFLLPRTYFREVYSDKDLRIVVKKSFKRRMKKKMNSLYILQRAE